MQNTKTCSCQCNENELLDAVRAMASEYKGDESSLIQVLHMAQGMFGYLPVEVQQIVADELDVPLSTVSGVVSFYSLFTAKPRGEHTIRVCLGTACYVRGGKKIVDRLRTLLGIDVGETTPDMRFTFEVARCIGACGLAPAMSIDDDVYKQVNPDNLEMLLAKYNLEDTLDDD